MTKKNECRVVSNAIKAVVPGFQHSCSSRTSRHNVLRVRGSRIDEYCCTAKNGTRTTTTLIPDQLYPILCYRMKSKVIDKLLPAEAVITNHPGTAANIPPGTSASASVASTTSASLSAAAANILPGTVVNTTTSINTNNTSASASAASTTSAAVNTPPGTIINTTTSTNTNNTSASASVASTISASSSAAAANIQCCLAHQCFEFSFLRVLFQKLLATI